MSRKFPESLLKTFRFTGGRLAPSRPSSGASAPASHSRHQPHQGGVTSLDRRTSQAAPLVAIQPAWDWFATMLDRHPFLAMPTLAGPPPRFGERGMSLTVLTMPANLAGLPALALPVPGGPVGLPASLQLIGPSGSEEQLIALGCVIEAALGR